MIGETLRTDLGYALRQLRRAPVLTVVVSASIAVGIAVATGAFSFLNGVLFKPLPVPDADGVYHVYTSDFRGRHDRYGSSSYRDYEDFAASNAFAGLAAVRRATQVAVSVGGAPPEDEYVAFASANYFDVLKLPLHLGRGFGDAREPVIVLSYPYWQRRFQGEASAIGQTMRINGVVLTVAGVAPERFRGTSMGPPSTGWAAAGLLPVITGDADALDSRGHRTFEVAGRLAPGQSADIAAARLNGVARGLALQDPPSWVDIRKEQRLVSVLSHRESLAPAGERGELVMGVAVATVLIVLLLGLVCTNVASLLVARAIARQREIAVRLALGASRARLVLQLFTESVLLALIGGGLGLAGVYWAVGFVRRFPVSDFVDFAPDWRVLLVALLVSLVAAVLFGAAPVLHSVRTDVRSALGSGAVTGDRSRLRGALITAQVAMSCVLILLAVTSTRGVRTQLRADPGVPLAGLISGRLNPRMLDNDTVRRRLYATQVREIIARTPGVNAVATTTLVPFGNAYTGMTVRLPDGGEHIVERNTVSADYFRVLRVRVLEGRGFDERDRAGAARVAVMNRTFRLAHPQAGPGTIVDIGRERYVQIVGVVDDIQYHDMSERPRPLLYLAAEQANAEDLFASLVIAVTPGAEEAMAGELRRRIGDRFPDLVPPRLMSLHDRLELETLPQRIAARVALGIGVVELVLAGVGLYGLLLFALLTRMREVGVRLALGAAPRVASWTVLKAGLRHAAIGTAIGLTLGVPASIAAKSVVPGVRETDLLPYLVAAATVACATVLAALVPALRAARVQPAAALRVD